ncbi:MAG: hypothetical protein ACOX3N_06025 [Dethiobacteria bacterium]
MARTCSICTHQERQAIDRALVVGTSLRDIAGQFGVSKSALHRHRAHIPEALTMAKEAEEAARADDLLAEVVELQNRAVSILDRAEKAGQLQTALNGIREARRCLKLLAQLQGELYERREVTLHKTANNDIAQRVIADPVATDLAHELLARIAENDNAEN